MAFIPNYWYNFFRVNNLQRVLKALAAVYMGRCTGEKAIGTGWTVAPPEEEESNWGGTTLTM